jgi:hypothetical protein
VIFFVVFQFIDSTHWKYRGWGHHEQTVLALLVKHILGVLPTYILNLTSEQQILQIHGREYWRENTNGQSIGKQQKISHHQNISRILL